MLVGGLEHGFYFQFHIWDVILPIDSYFSRWLKPPISITFGYPLVNKQFAIEDGHRNSGFTWIYPIKMVIFHSFLYVYQRVTVFLLDTQKSQEIQRHLSTLDLRLLPPACRTLAVGEGDFVFSEVRKKIGVPNDQHHDVPISNVFLLF